MFLGYIDPGTGFRFSYLSGWIFILLLGFARLLLAALKQFINFLKKHKKSAGVVISILSILAIMVLAMAAKKPGFNQKLIILGFDGMSPDIMEPMMLGGELPHFSQLMQEGSYRHLATTNPSQSPVAWAAFATGKKPGENGIFDFIIRNPKTYELSLSLQDLTKSTPHRVLKTKAFWQYTSRAMIPTIIIDCPLTFPPDKVYGRMLSGMGVPDLLGTEGTFTFYTSEPLPAGKDIGGKVFQVSKSNSMKLNLIGPRVDYLMGGTKNISVPFQATLKEKDALRIKYQGQDFELKKGVWSGWKDVRFSLGLKKIKGILQFYLVETQPDFKLYISPINFDPRDPLFPISYPRNYSKELAKHIGLYHTQGMPLDTWVINEKRLSEDALLSQADEIFKKNTSMLNFELNRFKGGVFFCYFGLTDTIQHMFWRYRDPAHPLYEKDAPQEYRYEIEAWYKRMDGVLGKVMQRLNKEDVLIVLSDHGFNTFRRTVHINTWLRENGYLYLNKTDTKIGRELLRDVDWSKTRAYAIGFGAIYINKQGREHKGIVRAGEETERLKEDISRKLGLWMDQKYNRAVVNKVYLSQEIFSGRFQNEAPDLYVGFNPGYRASWQTALGACPEELMEDNLKKWSGDHLFDPALIPGVIFTNRKITKDNPSIWDVCPTILQIAGFDERKLKKCGFDGKPLFSKDKATIR
jgi:predicted AlkP superfamily phosphohydrolase/phosphomutase